VEPAELAALVEKLAASIVAEGAGIEESAIVGIHTRGVPLAARLAAILNGRWGIRVELASMDITLYRDDLSDVASQPEVRATRIDFDVSGKRIILVDDVLFTGRTARAAISELLDFGRPGRIELAVLIDRGHQELPIRADHVGKKVETKASQKVEVHLKEIDGEDGVFLAGD
jgi:pyrimidine operon attenuation protein/uracil phosphoribosyltransferase